MVPAARYRKGYKMLELDVVQVASPVLRRGRSCNRSSLFGDRALAASGVVDFGDCPHVGKDLSNSILNDCM